SALRRGADATAFPWRLALRATGTTVPGAWVSAALPLAAGHLFVTNNVLAPALAARASRLAVGTAVVFALGLTADRLATPRPAWRWARSLPWPSRRRVVEDAVYLGAVAVPVVLVAAILSPAPAVLAVLALPSAALRAAGAMRRAGDGRLGGISSF